MDNTKTLVQGVDFTFDASAQTVTFAGFTPVQAQILVISNVTDNIIIYSSSQPATKGVLSGQVLTLTYDTTTMADSDNLQVRYATTDAQPISAAALPLPNGAATDAKLDTLIAKDYATQTTLAAILAKIIAAPATEAKQDTEITHLSAIQTAVQLIDNAISGNEMQVDVITLPSIPAGTNNIGDVDVLTLPAIPSGTNTIGDVGIKPRTSGGLTTYHLVSAASTNATVVKNSAGQLFGWYIYNSNAAARKVTFHNASSTPTAGASVFFSLVIPAG